VKQYLKEQQTDFYVKEIDLDWINFCCVFFLLYKNSHWYHSKW